MLLQLMMGPPPVSGVNLSSVEAPAVPLGVPVDGVADGLLVAEGVALGVAVAVLLCVGVGLPVGAGVPLCVGVGVWAQVGLGSTGAMSGLFALGAVGGRPGLTPLCNGVGLARALAPARGCR